MTERQVTAQLKSEIASCQQALEQQEKNANLAVFRLNQELVSL